VRKERKRDWEGEREERDRENRVKGTKKGESYKRGRVRHTPSREREREREKFVIPLFRAKTFKPLN